MEPFNIAKVPGLAYTVEMVRDFVVGQHASLTRVIAPYGALDPVYLLLLLFVLKFLVSIPLALKQGTDKCKDTSKFCGNTFDTFRSITRTLISVMVIVFYTMILARGFKAYGFFSVAGWTSFVATMIIAALALWAAQITKLASFESIYKRTSNEGLVSQDFKYGRVVYDNYTWWHFIQKEMYENFSAFNVASIFNSAYPIVIVFAILLATMK